MIEINNNPIFLKNAPFKIAIAKNFLSESDFSKLSLEYNSILSKGLSEEFNKEKLSRFASYDAYSFIPDLKYETFSKFYSQNFKFYLSNFFSNFPSNEVLLEIHYHMPNGKEGWIHTDDEVAFFSPRQKNEEYSNFWYHENNYRTGKVGDITVRRKIVMILYLNETEGGETVFYDDKMKEFLQISPSPNSAVFFEIGPTSFHRSLKVGNKERKTILYWIHILV